MKLFILHGWAYSTDKWQPVVAELKANGFDVTLLPIPGLTAPIDGQWTIDNYVEWLKKTLPNEPVILIGHSNGGRLSLQFTSRYPQRVQQLVLIDSAGIVRTELLHRVKKSISEKTAKIGKRVINHPKAKKLLYKVIGAHDYEQANPVMRQTMINLLESDKTLRLDGIKQPTLLIWGEDDSQTPLKDARVMQQAITGAKLHVVKQARHSPQFTDTAEVVDVITKRLRP
jgi:pimeloyl-ACP methyl ester carboxylesterase